MTNIGELHFINNTATPSGNGVMYFDGTDLKVKSGSAVRNLSQINSNTATRELDNLQNVALNTDIGMNGNSITGIEHIQLGTASSSPSAHGSIYASSTQVYIRIGSNTYTVSSFARELEELSDVTIGTPSANTVLKWSGSAWVDGNVVNDNIDGGANISQSKLNLAITNSEVSTGTFASITGIGTQSQNLNMNAKTIQNVETMNFSTFSATPSSNGVLFYDGTDLMARISGSTVNLTSGGGSSWVATATSDLDMNGNHIKNTTSSNGGSVTFEDNIDMRTYNVEGIDQLIFSNGSSSDSPPTWDTTKYGLEIEGGTSDTGLDIRVPSNRLIKFKTGNVTELQINGATGTLDVNSNKITSLGTPSSDYDASTKKYVDDEIAGVSGGSPQTFNQANYTTSHSEYDVWHPLNWTFFHSAGQGTQLVGMAPSTSKSYVYPLFVAETKKLYAISPYVSSASSGKMDVAIYSNKTNGENYPNSRLDTDYNNFLNFNGMSTNAGFLNYTLNAGLYWIVVKFPNDNSQIYHAPADWHNMIGWIEDDSPATIGGLYGWREDSPSSSFPSTFSAIDDNDVDPIKGSTGNIPLLWAKWTT